jgi:hypothetical protein
MKPNQINLVVVGDILATPCFLLLAIYFYNKKNKTILEMFLFIFAIIGFVFDLTSSLWYLKN